MAQQHTKAVLTALFVTALWASSIIIIKDAIQGVHPLSFAAHRYVFAALCLLVYALLTRTLSRASPKDHLLYLVLGATGYAGAQGGLYLGLSYLSAITYAFILSLSPLFASVMGVLALGERPTRIQYVGVACSMAGVAAFFQGRGVLDSPVIGIAIALASSVSWAAYHVFMRKGVSGGRLSMDMTVYPMMWGGAMLLVAALASRPVMPDYSAKEMASLIVLATVNTAWAFLLWTKAQRMLFAFEQTVIHNATLPFSAVFAVLALSESVTLSMVVGMILLFAGALLVQSRHSA